MEFMKLASRSLSRRFRKDPSKSETGISRRDFIKKLGLGALLTGGLGTLVLQRYNDSLDYTPKSYNEKIYPELENKICGLYSQLEFGNPIPISSVEDFETIRRRLGQSYFFD